MKLAENVAVLLVKNESENQTNYSRSANYFK